MRLAPSPTRWLPTYFLAGTAVFWVLDFVVHAPVRVALSTPSQRAVYYVGLLCLGLLTRWKPGWSPVVGVVESAVNITLLFVGLWLPILALSDAVTEGTSVQPPFTGWRVANAALALLVMRMSLKRSEAALMTSTGVKRQ